MAGGWWYRGQEEGRWTKEGSAGRRSVVELALSRLVHQHAAALGLPGAAVPEQVEAAQGVARQELALGAVPRALGRADLLGRLREAGSGREGSGVAGCVAAGPAWSLHSAHKHTEAAVRETITLSQRNRCSNTFL